jgi:DNA-binding beta-propeller fold protein YncE
VTAPPPSVIRRRRTAALAVIALLISGLVGAFSVMVLKAGGGRVGATRSPGSRGSQPATAGKQTFEALQPGSDPGVLPGPVLIADRDNNRLLEVSPTGRVLWRFPAPGDLLPGQTFRLPDDAFFSPDGHEVIATQEDDFVISVIDIATRRIVYRYGHPGVPGSEPGYLNNPDDALLMPGGEILSADIKNCRIVVIRPPAHRVLRQLGQTGYCAHEPGLAFASPNGAFPMAGGRTAVTEISGDWLDVLDRNGRPVLATHPPGFSYPSDTNEVRRGLFLSADYTSPGALETFASDGSLRWRFQPTGADALNQPSLALPLPNGDVLANDDKNDRVIVVDPRTDRSVWQYGRTHQPGAGPGLLSNPDGVDLAPPYSLAARFGATLHAP